MERMTIRISGMSCQHCKRAVEQEVAGVEGVTSVEVDLEQKLAIVAFNPPANEGSIRDAIEEAGYTPE